MSAISCRKIVKTYTGRKILDGINLELSEGGIFALLGCSGVGKSTLGRIICGLETADQGTVTLSKPARIMLIPQDFVIWPHLTVQANIALGYHGLKSGCEEMTSRWLARLGISATRNRRAGELSYGQQQRVAVARAFCFQPGIMILDEPFAHFDAPSRAQAAREISELCLEQKITTLWITHDAREAFAVAEKIAILDGGLIRQFADPETVYRHPRNEAVALLTGEMNIFKAEEWKEFASSCESTEPLPEAGPGQRVGVRPADLELVPATVANGCVPVQKTFVGHGYQYQVRLPSGMMVTTFNSGALALDRTCKFRMKAAPCLFTED